MSEHRSLVDVLSSHAEQRPAELAYRFLAKGEVTGAATLYSFERLAQRAHAIGAWLQERVGVGQRALLLYPPGLDFVEAFLGCLSAGVIAVPAFPPRSVRTLPRLQSIVANAEPALVLSTAAIADTTRNMASASGALAMLPWQVTSEIGDEHALHWRHPGVDQASLAFLQYTSGSTSSPKGVVVSHGNLLANQRAIVAAMRHSERDLQDWSSDLFVSWLPLQHDMGLIGPVLHGLYMGRATTLMSPLHFLQKPLRWLQAISHYRAHTSGAPNFAYELCVTKAEANPALLQGLDLSHWKTAFNGAEPVRWATLERFAKTFAPCGFRPDAFVPCYGMAETTLLVTGRRAAPLPGVFRADPAQLLFGHAEPSERGRPLVSCGVSEEQIIVVDPERRVACPEGEVGELWIAGPSVAQGYWQNPQATAESFGVKLRGAGPDAPTFLRSGDLGFLHSGELFVTGRLKDVLIVDGSNHYPQDLEHTAEQAHPSVRQSGVAAFALDTAAGERPAIVAEVKLARDVDPEQVIAAIRGAISDAHGVAVCSVALVRPQLVPKTSSGKVQRGACRSAFERSELELIARRDFEQLATPLPAVAVQRVVTDAVGQPTVAVPPPIAAELVQPLSAQPLSAAESELARAFLLSDVARRARVGSDAVSVDRPLSELGLGSRELVELTGALGELLDRELSPALLYDCPTIGHVLRRLEGAEQATEQQAATGQSQEPIAIVSMACRFPSDINTPEALWSALEQGKDLVTRFPEGRWDTESLYDPDPDAKGKCYTREAALLPQIDRFDAAFFDVPEREASSMDPQQRLLLEVSWEALERAGVLPASLNESVTGVYVGMFDSGYLEGASLEQLDGYYGTGAISSAASGRIAYTLGLQGPAVTVDTACSASLVAVHLAAQALRNGECDLALAGGVTLMVTPRLFVEFSRVRGLSPSGRCKSFADDADGANWGEGCGMLLLKRLSDAQRDGDHVLATLRGSALNQDGRSQGLTAPNGPAQERVIKRALAASGLSPSDIDYVEAHGTGTPLGDPIEAGALARVFGGEPRHAPLWLGSLKSNIAHTQAAAGVAGLIKVVLALAHEQLPRTLHVAKPTRHIAWNTSGLALVTEAQPWPAGARPRRAGVSAFGVSGTNAHVVVEEAPARALAAPSAQAPQPLAAGAGVYVLSARSEAALRAQATRLRQYLAERPEVALPDVALTLATRRTIFNVRAAVVAKERQVLLDALASLGAGAAADALVQASEQGAARGKIAFVFPGQGSQWPDMGKLLLQRSPVFAQSVARCDLALARHTGWSVAALLRGEQDPSALERIEVVQPALFTMMVSLAALWKALGVTPQAVVGHSQGELAAACVAGALSLEDAATVVARRSQILTRVVGQGGSAAVEMPVEALQARLAAGWGDRLAVAAWNGARSAVVSGEQQALQELLTELEREQVFARRLRMTVASHSAQMDALEREVKAQLAGVTGHVSTLPMYSTVLAQRIWGDELSCDYWYRNLREPVRFVQTLQQLLADGYRTFVEVSPHPILSLAVESAADAAELAIYAIGSLRRDEDADCSLKLAAAKLHVAGHSLPLAQLVAPGARPHDALPTYAFDRKRYWAEPERPAAHGGMSTSDHPLLGASVASARGDRQVFVSKLGRGTLRWLSQYQVFGEVVLSGASVLELCRAALLRARPEQDWEIAQLEVKQPLLLPEHATVQVQAEVSLQAGRAELTLHSRPFEDAAWTLHATAEGLPQQAASDEPLAPSWPERAEELWGPHADAALTATGVQYGDALRCVRSAIRLDSDTWLVRASLAEHAEVERFGLHPALLEAALQAATVFEASEALLLPASLARWSLLSPGQRELLLQVERTHSSAEGVRLDVTLWDELGVYVGRASDLWLRPVSRASLAPTPQPERVSAHGHGERTGFARALSRLTSAQRRERLIALLREEVAQVLSVRAPNSLPSDQPLRQLGLDSLKSVDLRNRIAARLGQRLAATLLFDHPTLDKLTDYLLRSVLQLDDAPSAAPARAAVSGDEPIALVSMACRLPGGVDSPEALWAALEAGRDLVEDFPAERWDVDALYDPDPEAVGKSYARQGGFIHGLDQFDPAFFEISPREARAMDPQQRLLLETAWEALERAGIVPSSLNESVTGVYIGTFDSGYHEGIGLEQMDGYCATGAFPSVASGRLSYTLGLQGPALTIDTACSSSLVAVDLACRALRSGQCDLALAGGVSLLLTPHGFVEFSRLRGLSPSGRCHAFSEQADGASWAEGCGIVVLKRLSDAQRDGDRVLALVRGSAVNQDGKSQGLTAPNGPAQERVIRAAIAASALRPDDIDYVEAHGTGTTLGDPIEAGALAAVFGAERGGRALRLGSLKSNLAHTQAAAGVSGLIKVVLSLQHELLPKSLYADTPSSHVDWEQSGLELLSDARPWKRGARVRRAGVSAFGISGTNAHVVVEEPPRLTAAVVEKTAAPLGAWPLAISARDARGLRDQAERLASWLEAHPDADLGAVAYTAALHRSHFEQRAAVLANDSAQAVSALRGLAADQHTPTLVRGQKQRGGKVVFVFPGQGSQWAGMGRALLAQSPTFARALEECDRALLPLTGWSVLALLRGDSAPELPPLDRVDAVQPALFALSIGLVAVLRALGIEPDAVVGHSQGEVTAAVVSGALSLEHGAKVVALRSQAVREKSGQGGMLLIERPVAEVEALLAPYGSQLSIAAVNTASSTVVSGERAAIDALAAQLEQEALFSRRVNVDYASHSAQMDSLLPALAEALADIQPRAGTIPLYSTVRCEPLSGEELDASYFCRNLREPVRLDRALEQLLEDGHGVFIEVSAHPLLTLSLSELRDRASAIVVGTLQRERGDLLQLLASLCELHVQGYALPWRALFPSAVHQLQPLPTYAFQRQRYWLEADSRHAGSALEGSDHPLLGAVRSTASGDRWLFTSRLGRGSHKWLQDHALFDQVLLSGTTLLELCHAAVAAIERETPHVISQLALLSPVILPERGQLQLQVEVVRAAAGLEIAVHTREDAAWTLHATAHAEPEAAAEAPSAPRWPALGEEHWRSDTYDRLERLGLHYGAAFRSLRSALRLRPDAVLARVSLPEALREDAARYGLHPALLDAAQHSALALSELGDAVMAASVERWSLAHRGAHSLLVLTEQISRSEHGARLQLTLWDEHGAFIGRLSGLDVRRVTPASLRRSSQLERDVYEVRWQPVARAALPPQQGVWALVADAEHAQPLALQLKAAGIELIELRPEDPLPEGVEKVLRMWPQNGAASVEHSLPELAEALCVQALGELQAAVAGANAPQQWVWLTHGAVASAPEEGVPCLSQSGLWGLARSARAEYPNLGLRQIDLGDVAPDLELLLSALATPDEPELALRGSQLRAPRLLRAELAQRFVLPDGGFALSSRRRGSLDALELSELSVAPLEPGQVRIEVHSAGMNFRDVIYALDVQASELASKAVLHTALGSECAGVVTEVADDVVGLRVGQRVLAIAQGSLASEVVADARLVVEIPAQLSFEDAATIPVAFTTAYYGLRELAAIQPGEKLLVHAAAGGVGMAALQLARAWGVEVYATASPSKWRVLAELGIPAGRVASSRDLTFAREFSAGVDVVLNSLARTYVDASLALLRPGGRFLELGKTDVRSRQSVTAAHGDIGYWAYDLLEVGPSRVGEMLREVVALVARGELTPLRRQPFPLQEARAAFRLMAHGGHVGKIVLNMPRAQHSVPQSGTILITGGLSGLGLASARRLAERGAKQLLLLSRRGDADPNAHAAVESLRALGAEVRVAACDISDRSALAAQLAAIAAHAPLTGIVHSAAVLDDGLLVDQTPERVARVLSPKVRGGYYLHELTAHLPLQLFVMYSSAAGVAGSPGQTNYAAANVFLDQLCHERRARGLPAASLAWGGWSEVGLAVKHVDLARNDARGYVTMTPAHGLALLELALTRSTAPHQVLWTLQPALLQKTFGVEVPAMWRGIVQPKPVDTRQRGELSESLARLPAAARHDRVVELLCDDAASVLGLRAAGDVPSNQPLKQLGLDSLMALELRNRISARFQCRLSPSLLFDHPTLDALGRYLLEHVLELHAAPAAIVPAANSVSSAEPIAIISMACRYPAGVDTPEALWSVLQEGRDLVEDVPAERWDISALFDADPDAPGKTYARQGGFVRDVDKFDAAFFEIAPREARAMDPQQRLLLETAWEALERAGVVPSSLNESLTGVYVGMFESGYFEGTSLDQMDGYSATGSTCSVASGRLAYTLGLQGPAITVDTACSSSLVAIHLASQALRAGECDMALAGGITLMLTPRGFVEFSRVRLVSPSGRCKSFSDEADGAGWSDGCGMLLLKRLSDAQRDGDRVLGVIRATAVNQDGRSQGLTAPNGPAQERVMRRALELAQLSAADVDYVEAHGTGTALGDPIEANALSQVYGRARPAGQPLWMGSLKSNLAHSQAASGVGGVMKVVLSLLHEQLPATLYAARPTRHVDWEHAGIALVDEPRAWARGERVRRAGVSAFGISGTNAHVIIEEAPPRSDAGPARPEEAIFDAAPLLIAVSARSQVALREQAARLADYVERCADLRDVAYTLAQRRSHFERRAALVARQPDELAAQLRALAAAESGSAPERVRTRGKLAFVFPGHGPQWLAMGKALSERCPVFARELERCDAALLPHTGFSVLAVLRGEPDAPDLERVDVVQPALFAITVALCSLWRALGIEPDAVVGHSFGEIAAAHVAGALSLQDAAQVVALRARALAPLSDLGGMAVVEQPAAALSERLRARYPGRLEIGAYNSPSTCAVSGDARAIEALLAELEQEAVFARRVRIRFASHSSHVESARERILQQLDTVRGDASQLPLYSTVEGNAIEGSALDAGYFYRNLREPVQFAAAIERMQADGYRFFVELSPHPMLLSAIDELAQRAGLPVVTVGSLRREQDPVDNIYAALAQLYAGGRELAWEKLLPQAAALDPELPTYAFDRQSYTRELSRKRSAHGPLVQQHVESSERPGEHVFETALDLSDPNYRYLEGHRIVGAIWLPGSALLEMALEAGRLVYPGQEAALEQVSFERAIELAEQGATRLQLLVQPELDGRRSFRVVSRAPGTTAWTTNAQGYMRVAAPGSQAPIALAQLREQCTQELDGATFYSLLAAAGFERGATFQLVSQALRGELQALAQLAPLSAAEHLVHPALLDAALQAITLPTRFPSERAFVPAGVESLQLYGSQRPAWAVCKLRDLSADSVTADILLLDAQERVVLEVRGFREVAEARLPKLVHAVQWRALPNVGPQKPVVATQPWLVLADRRGIAERLGGPGSVYLLADVQPDAAGARATQHVDPTRVADFVRVLREAFGAEPPQAIVHAWSLDAPAIDSAQTLAQAERLCCTSTLCLVQAIEALAWTPRPRLFILTERAQRAVAHPEQALAWGFGASLAQEHPELSPTLIDLDDAVSQRDALTQLLLDPVEPRIALHGSERSVPRLVRQALPNTASKIRSDRSYLISGGLGGLGLVIAERLIALGARHLVLLSRRGERREDHDKLVRLRSTGARVQALAADVTDRASLASALASVTPAIAGVIHAAGVIEDGTALNLSPARVGAVLGPKTLGTALLAELLPDVELFVLFSSISAVLGSAGQTVYAAANAYLDAWAQQRTAAGKPALSLAWGPWSEVGMASDPTLRQKNLGASLIDPITPEEGAELFQLSLSSQRPQLVLAGLDRERLAAVASELPLLHELCRPQREQAGSTSIVRQISLAPDAAARRALLQQYLSHAVARVADSSVAPSPDSALKELGLDSLMLLNLRNLISRELHVELSTGKLLSLPTIAELAEHLQDALASGALAAPTTERAAGPVTQAERWPATRDVMRLLRSEQQGTPNAAHNIGTAARLHGKHSSHRIESILQGIALRHVALRTAIVPDPEHGHAMLAAPALFGQLLRRSELSLRLDALPDRGTQLINERLCALLEPAFSWSEAPLWRFELIEDSAGVQVLLLGAHHAVSDARSIMMVLGELDAELGGRALSGAASNRDLDSLLRAQPLSAAEAPSEATPVDWHSEFAGAKRLELTLASPRPSTPSYRLGGVSLPAPAGLFERVGVAASQLGVTPAAYFMGVLCALIGRVAGQSRFAVGVPVDTRGHADAQDALGFFGVPVPLPAAVELEQAICDIIRRTDQQFARVLERGAAFANALPALVAQGLHQQGAPLIELFFNYINPKLSAFERLSLLDVGAGYGDVDLMVVVAPALQQVRLEFQVDILDADSCRLLGQAYLDLLNELSERPARSVAQIQLSPALERVARAAKPRALPVAATFALGELPEFLDATFREAGLPVAVAEAPYHQVLASLLDPAGVFAQPGGLAAVVLLRGVDLIRYRDDWSDKSLRELADEYAAALTRLSQRTNAAPLLVGFLPDAADDVRFRSWEQQLAEQLRNLPGVVVLRAQDWTEHYPVEERFAVEADVLGHLPFCAQFLAAVALTITRKVWGMRQRPLKVVAVDGDNTLWSGIAGEIGPDAVGLSGPRAALARKLLELRAAGVLLVLVSNNDDTTVRQVLARADSTLRAEHFSVISAEWDDKHARLTRAAESLSLGLDSFVFLDDNPVEIAAVRARLPQVMAITVPATDELESFLSNLWALDVRAVTLEDSKRAGYYEDEAFRKSMRDEVDDFATFVQRLDLRLEFALLNAETLERSVQLTRRTNQFNLRPSQPAARALATLSAQPNTEVWTLKVRDRFGDYGQVGVIALEKRGATLEVLGLMLSCRVLGRGVEERIVHWLADRVEALSCSTLDLIAEHTERNMPARKLVAALGGGQVESQRLAVSLSSERLRAFRAHAPSSEITQRTGEVDVHGY